MIANKKRSKTICITGTHHTPAVELIRQLKSDPEINWKIEYIGHIYPTENHILHTIIPKLNINFHQIEGGKFDRRYLPNTIRGIPKTIQSIFTSLKLIKEMKPDIIVSFGGYISVPVIFAGFLNHTPSITHEQTLTISLSTKINSLFVNKIALSFDNSDKKSNLPHNKIVVTGNLLRSDIYKQNSTKYRSLNSTINQYPLIFVTGGNQGSSPINKIIEKTIPELSEKYTIIHHTGKNDYPYFQKNFSGTKNYYPTEFVDQEDIGWVLNKARIIIGRSGANSCQEIVALQKNSILIPLPVSQQNEQLLNAHWTKKNLPTQTIIIKQSQLTAHKIFSAVKKLNKNTTNLNVIHQASNKKLLHLIHEII